MATTLKIGTLYVEKRGRDIQLELVTPDHVRHVWLNPLSYEGILDGKYRLEVGWDDFTREAEVED